MLFGRPYSERFLGDKAHSISVLQQVFWYGSVALSALTVARLAHLRLIGKSPYKAFAAMQIGMLSRDLVLLCIPLRTIQYTIVWEVTLPLVLVTQIWAGTDCYRSLAALYPKIGGFGVWLFSSALVLSAVLSLAGLPIEVAHLHPEPVLRSLYLCYQWTDTLLAGSLVLAVAFLSRFPSPVRRLPVNLVRHTAILATYFSLYALANLMPAWRTSIDAIRMPAVCLLYGVWVFALSKSGEEMEEWPQLDSEAFRWIAARQENLERLYHEAAASNGPIGRAK